VTDPVDIPAIASRLGVARQTVDMWRHRKVLPAPDYPQLSVPVWEWLTIAHWAEQTGRL
jgi:hypothetical protein